MSKIVKKRKGTVSHYDDDSFEFSPYGKGEKGRFLGTDDTVLF